MPAGRSHGLARSYMPCTSSTMHLFLVRHILQERNTWGLLNASVPPSWSQLLAFAKNLGISSKNGREAEHVICWKQGPQKSICSMSASNSKEGANSVVPCPVSFARACNKLGVLFPKFHLAQSSPKILTVLLEVTNGSAYTCAESRPGPSASSNVIAGL